MKKFIVAAFALALSSTALLADDPGDVRFSVYGGGGLTYSAPDLSDGEEAEFSAGYLGGANAFYALTSQFSVLGGFEYSYKKLRLKDNTDYTYAVKEQYYSFLLGGRFMNFEALYVDFGLFAAIPTGSWKVEGEGLSATIDKSARSNEFGVFFGIGYLFPISETLDFNLGAACQIALTPGYEEGDESLTSRMGYLKAGLDFKF